MTVQETSRMSWEALQPTLSDRQRDVFTLIAAWGSLCNTEISDLLDVPVSYVTPRVGELRRLGLVTESHRAKYEPTNRTVIFWKAA